MNFEAYLYSKKIDSAVFKQNEPLVWGTWQKEFEEMSPASFTAQKLYLINPIRRKYHYQAPPEPLKEPVTRPAEAAASSSPKSGEENLSGQSPGPEKPVAKPGVPRPVFKPKPKLNS